MCCAWLLCYYPMKMNSWILVIFGIIGVQCVQDPSLKKLRTTRQSTINLGVCKILLDSNCPKPEIKYFLYTKKNIWTPEAIDVTDGNFKANISASSFNRHNPIKIIIHGYNSGMFLNALVQIKNQYLQSQDLNVFAIDWSPLAQGPCYPAAVWNARVAGKCAALLVDRLKSFTKEEMHVIGFSLGAHVAAFMATNLLPYKVARITGLDPAMPGFSLVGKEDKLDSSDAHFVDIIHTNAFFQGHYQEGGHVDFYVNGGVIQPGCWADDRFFSCNHHRAPFYFAESINSEKGFWGWPCSNYFQYLVGRCPITEPQIRMGDRLSNSSRGMHLVITDSVPPFAVGKFTGPTIEILKSQPEKEPLNPVERYRIGIFDCLDDQDNGNNCGNSEVMSFRIGDNIFDNIID